MDFFKLGAYISEFPFLIRLLPPEDIEDIQVKRWDATVLGLIPQEFELVGSLVDVWRQDKWYIARHEATAEIGIPDHEYRSNYAHDEPHHKPGRTLLASLDRHIKEEEWEPEFLVNVVHEHNATAGRKTTDMTWLTIYKPPRTTTLAAILDEARAKAAAFVAAECNF